MAGGTSRSLRFRALQGKRVGALRIGDGFIYVCEGLRGCTGATIVLDATTGRVVGRSKHPVIPVFAESR